MPASICEKSAEPICDHEWDERGYPHWPVCVKCGAYPPASDEPFMIPDGDR